MSGHLRSFGTEVGRFDDFRSEHVGHGPLVDEAAEVEDVDVGADAHHQLDIVLYEEDGHPFTGQFLEQVAEAISEHCLVGWDTGGVDWEAPENWDDRR
jgi:hypothetical protein